MHTPRYIIYARKSSESEERQVQSIDDQIDYLKHIAVNRDLKIVKIFTEQKSAKTPDVRPQFQAAMDYIKSGRAEGILCWKLNRLSRNALDSGRLQWLLQQKIITSLITSDKEYLPDDNVLLFSVESGMDNQFIVDLRKNTIRGLEGKLSRGWLPARPTIGYRNNKLDKTIEKDPERFLLVRRMWDQMLTGLYNPYQILNFADEWGLRTPKYKHMGNRPLSRSGIYRILSNPFYMGLIQYDGKTYQGKHEPMITKEEFDRVQILLRRKPLSKPIRHTFLYTGLMSCGECGCVITAERKKGRYVYYHCTRKRREVKCFQKGLREELIEEQLTAIVKDYTISPVFLDWAIRVINDNSSSEIEQRKQIIASLEKSVALTSSEIERLLQLLIRGIIEEDAYKREKELLESRLQELKSSLAAAFQQTDQRKKLLDSFSFTASALETFLTGDAMQKKNVVKSICKSATLLDGHITIEPYEWLEPIKKSYPSLEKAYQELELPKNAQPDTKGAATENIFTVWGGYRGSNPR